MSKRRNRSGRAERPGYPGRSTAGPTARAARSDRGSEGRRRDANERGSSRGRGRCWALWLGGGLLVAAPFLADVLEPLAFVSLVPWLLAAEREAGRLRGVALRAYLGGFVFLAAGLSWLHVVSPVAIVVTAGYFALYVTSFAVAHVVMRRELALPAWLSAPAAVIACETLAQHVTLFPVTWLFQGYASWRISSLVQVAELGGIQLVSGLQALVAAAIVSAIVAARGGGVTALRHREAWVGAVVAVLVLGAVAGYGAWRIGSLELREGPTVALVQGNVPQVERNIAANADAIVEKHVVLSLSVRDESPDLVAWPESASNHFFESDLPVQRVIGQTAQALGTWLVVGAIGENPPPDPPSNSLYLVAPDGSVAARADKRVLVPGAETLLVLDLVPPLRDPIADFLSRTMHFRPYLKAGDRAVLFRAGPWVFGPLVCYGDVVPVPAEELAAAGADALIVASNEAWFGERELDQHLAMASVRSIETRLPMGRATNDGLTATIDPAGRVVAELPRETDGVLVDTLLVTDTWRVPPWVRRLFTLLISGVALASTILGIVLARRQAGASAAGVAP